MVLLLFMVFTALPSAHGKSASDPWSSAMQYSLSQVLEGAISLHRGCEHGKIPRCSCIRDMTRFPVLDWLPPAVRNPYRSSTRTNPSTPWGVPWETLLLHVRSQRPFPFLKSTLLYYTFVRNVIVMYGIPCGDNRLDRHKTSHTHPRGWAWTIP